MRMDRIHLFFVHDITINNINNHILIVLKLLIVTSRVSFYQNTTQEMSRGDNLVYDSSVFFMTFLLIMSIIIIVKMVTSVGKP